MEICCEVLKSIENPNSIFSSFPSMLLFQFWISQNLEMSNTEARFLREGSDHMELTTVTTRDHMQILILILNEFHLWFCNDFRGIQKLSEYLPSIKLDDYSSKLCQNNWLGNQGMQDNHTYWKWVTCQWCQNLWISGKERGTSIGCGTYLHVPDEAWINNCPAW